MDHLPLFVFGTLRRGQCNHDAYLAGRYEHCLKARLPGFERVAPLMIAPCPQASVDGELYLLRRDGYDEAMRQIDELESIRPGETVGPEYRRIRVRVETGGEQYTAWAYVRPD